MLAGRSDFQKSRCKSLAQAGSRTMGLLSLSCVALQRAPDELPGIPQPYGTRTRAVNEALAAAHLEAWRPVQLLEH